MDFREQVTKWVEKKIGEVIDKDLHEKVVDKNSSFDVETYANYLLDKHFNNDVEQMKEIFNQDSFDDLIYSEMEYSTGDRNSLRDSLEFDSNDCQTFLEGDVIKNLESNSRESRRNALKVLESRVEDYINQSSWNKIMETLQKILANTADSEMYNSVLKIFQKLLKCSKKPQAVCKGFGEVARTTAKQIVLFNLEPFEESYDLKEGKWRSKNNPERGNIKHRNLFHSSGNAEVLIKLMWLLVDCQQKMPVQWGRFNESRLRDIIFSFVHLLSATTIPENKLSGLELLSVLNPTASWCRHYCHTAVGRSLLCSALKKYKAFFKRVVELILNHIRIKKHSRLPPIGNGVTPLNNSDKLKREISEVLKPHNKFKNVGNEMEKHEDRLSEKNLHKRSNWVRSAPVEQRTDENEGRKIIKLKNLTSDWIVNGIPRKVVDEAVFCHSVLFVTCLIQFRCGRALFPVHTAVRKRLVSLQDFSICLVEYLESVEYEWGDMEITSNYKIKLLESVEILKSIKSNINSSRSTEG